MHWKQNIFNCLTGNVFLFTFKRIYIVKISEETFDKSCNDYLL